MSKKLLEEAAVRKFMKIAGLQPLTSTFLKESEDVQEEAKKKDKEDKKEELDEVEDLEEGKDELEEAKDDLEEGYGKKKKEELEEGGGQMPFDEATRRVDERAPEDRVQESKMVKPVKGKGAKQTSHKLSKTSVGTKNGVSGKGLVKEEDMPQDDMGDVEGTDSDMGGSDPATEEAVKRLLNVVVNALKQETGVEISMEDEASGEEAEVEMGGEVEGGEVEGGEEEGGEEMEGGDEALDEAALENVVAETVKRVKARLSESVSKPNKKVLTKEALAKKVAARVAERLKKR